MRSRIILGTVQFGLDYGISNREGKPSQQVIAKILDLAYSSGIRTLDTADAYGSAIESIGSYMNKTGRKFEINTKFKNIDSSVTLQLEQTLSVLPVDHINTYFFHSFEDFKLKPELLDELRDMRGNKLINKIGLSIYDDFEFREAINNPIIDVIQFPFNMLDNWYHRGKLIEKAKINKKSLQARSIFLQGLFFKRISEVQSNFKALVPALESIQQVSNQYNISVEQLALGYAMQQKDIEHIVIGVDNYRQLERNLYLTSKTLKKEIIDQINQIVVKETSLLYPKNWKL